MAHSVHYRARKGFAVSCAAVLAGLSLNQRLAEGAYAYDPNDFAVEVVSSKGLAGAGLYDSPEAVLGRPALKFNNGTVANPVYRRAKLIEAPFNRGMAGEKLITTIGLNTEIVVRMGRQVANHANNPFGVDFIVFGNSFYAGGAPSDSTNLNTTTLTGGIFSEPVKVSVSQNGTDWYTYDSGPYADGAFATNSYEWSRNVAAWTDNETDPTKPVNPAFASQIAGKSAADVLDLYDGSAGGTGFDLAASGFDWIQYIRVTGVDGFAGGEIDAFAAVRPVPEPAGVGVMLIGVVGLLGRRRRRLG